MEKPRGPILLLAAHSTLRRWVVIALLPLLYVVSFGPACGLAERDWVSHSFVLQAYSPCWRVVVSGTPVLADGLLVWATTWGGNWTRAAVAWESDPYAGVTGPSFGD